MIKGRIRDLRHKEKFVIDDVYLNGYARHCGINATGVYMALCRHASQKQEAFPSIKRIAEKLSISSRSVVRALKLLEGYKIVQIQRRKTGRGTYHPNLYVLLDRSEWKPIHMTHSHLDNDKPCDSQSPAQVTHSHHKGKATIEVYADKTSAVHEFLKYTNKTFAEKYGVPMTVNVGKNGKLIKDLLKIYDLEKLKELWSRFLVLADIDEFIHKKAGVSISVFNTQINKLISSCAKAEDWRA